MSLFAKCILHTLDLVLPELGPHCGPRRPRLLRAHGADGAELARGMLRPTTTATTITTTTAAAATTNNPLLGAHG